MLTAKRINPFRKDREIWKSKLGKSGKSGDMIPGNRGNRGTRYQGKSGEIGEHDTYSPSGQRSKPGSTSKTPPAHRKTRAKTRKKPSKSIKKTPKFEDSVPFSPRRSRHSREKCPAPQRHFEPTEKKWSKRPSTPGQNCPPCPDGTRPRLKNTPKIQAVIFAKNDHPQPVFQSPAGVLCSLLFCSLVPLFPIPCSLLFCSLVPLFPVFQYFQLISAPTGAVLAIRSMICGRYIVL